MNPILTLAEVTEERRNQLRSSIRASIDHNEPGEPIYQQEELAGFTVSTVVGYKNPQQLGSLDAEELAIRNFEAEVLSKTGTMPLATLPAKLWQDFCLACGLYRFENMDAQGRTGILFRHDEFEKKLLYSQRMEDTATKITIILMLLSFVGTCVLRLQKSAIWLPVGILTILCVITLIVLDSKKASKLRSNSVHEQQRRLWEQKRLKNYWPNLFDYPVNGNASVIVHFPTPPQEFGNRLLAVQRADYHACVAVTPDAISIVEGSYRPDAEPNVEPVLYVRSADGATVSLLAQFGDFPNEQAAITMAQKCAERYYANL
ncbi:MAG: hypothetical protein WCV85_05190 [Patescibacteria group bacterium]